MELNLDICFSATQRKRTHTRVVSRLVAICSKTLALGTQIFHWFKGSNFCSKLPSFLFVGHVLILYQPLLLSQSASSRDENSIDFKQFQNYCQVNLHFVLG